MGHFVTDASKFPFASFLLLLLENQNEFQLYLKNVVLTYCFHCSWVVGEGIQKAGSRLVTSKDAELFSLESAFTKDVNSYKELNK